MAVEGMQQLGECAAKLMDIVEEEKRGENYRISDVCIVAAVDWDEGDENQGWIRFYSSTGSRHLQYGLLRFAAQSAMEHMTNARDDEEEE